MKILLAFETYSGGTMAASEFAAKILTTKGHTVELKRSSELQKTEFDNYDLVILATPSWLERGDEGQPHENFLKFIDTFQGVSFANKKFALFGLGDQTYAHFGRGVDRLATFVTNNGGQIISTPLKIDGFYFNQKQNEEILQSWIENLPLN